MIGVFKSSNLLVITAALSYIVQMIIVPKSVTTPVVVILGLALLLYLYLNQCQYSKIRIPPYLICYLPFVVWVALSSFWTISTNYSFALIRVFLVFEFGCIAGFLATSEEKMKKVLYGLVLGGLISSAVVLYNQYMFIGIIRIGRYIYGSPMEFSGGLCASAYCCVFLWKLEKRKIWLFLYLCFIFLCALSGSRSAILYPVIFFTLMEMLYLQRFSKIVGIILVAGLLGGMIFFACMKSPALYNVVGYRVEQLLVDKTDDGSYMERSEMKRYGYEFWTESPIIGLGVDGFAQKYGAINKRVFSHCDYWECLSCFGVIGALLLYCPYFLILRRRGLIRLAKGNLWRSFLLAILVMNIIRLANTIEFLNLKDGMMMAMICNVFLKRERIEC